MRNFQEQYCYLQKLYFGCIMIISSCASSNDAICICSLMNEVVHTSPTIGSNVEEVVWKNIHFIMWDIGGQESLRATWNTYFTNTKVSRFMETNGSAYNASMVNLISRNSLVYTCTYILWVKCLVIGMYRIFASLLNSGPNSVFIFGRIVLSERNE